MKKRILAACYILLLNLTLPGCSGTNTLETGTNTLETETNTHETETNILETETKTETAAEVSEVKEVSDLFNGNGEQFIDMEDYGYIEGD